MKNLFIALMALALTLGVACKKESVVEPVKEKELKIDKLQYTGEEEIPTEHHANSLTCRCPGCCKPQQIPPPR